MEYTRAVGRAALLRWHALPDEHDALQRKFQDLGTEVSACAEMKEGAPMGRPRCLVVNLPAYWMQLDQRELYRSIAVAGGTVEASRLPAASRSSTVREVRDGAVRTRPTL